MGSLSAVALGVRCGLSLMVFLIQGEVGETVNGGARETEGSDGTADEDEDEEEPTDKRERSLPVFEKDSTEHGWVPDWGLALMRWWVPPPLVMGR